MQLRWFRLSDCVVKRVTVSFLIHDKTYVTVTIWKCTICDKPNNCELGWNKKPETMNNTTPNLLVI